ncbi:MAG: ParA family protein [Bacteroidetes bacterium]|nr:MAG: ParA family protein [Bacteroidota bacterium]TAG88669.1 MAG: ParA family protein [Bacteroidota bacterium]
MNTRIIAMVNHKGGVGKTTTTLHLGKALSMLGKKVLIIDSDPQANLSQSLKIEEPKKEIYHALCEKEKLPIQNIATNFDIVPASLALSGAELKLIGDINGYFRLKESLQDLPTKYDFVLIDCPPSLGILTVNALIAATEIMLIVQSQYLAIKGLQTIMELIDELRKNLNQHLKIGGLLLTQVNRTIVSKNIVEAVQAQHEEKVFKTVIRQNVSIVEASTMGQDIFSYAPESMAAEDYSNLAKEVVA